jgi:hypothetical protein
MSGSAIAGKNAADEKKPADYTAGNLRGGETG